MSLIRRHLGVWTFAWLSCQVAALSALVPGVCCVAHQELAATTECHETTPADACPMRGVDGQACPMHDGSSTPDASEQCAMRATCSIPAMAVASLFSVPGVLFTQSTASIDPHVSLMTEAADHLPAAAAALDTPPPRS
jgi:hypothetical protein